MGSFSLSFILFILAGLVWSAYGDVGVETISPGDGKTFPKKGQRVTVHYTGTLEDGKVIDSSRGGTPFTFQIGTNAVIRGLSEGVAKMSLGERAKIIISPDYGYGVAGFPGIIPPNAILFYDMELLAIN